MTNVTVIGMQWGDEGKGKIVDCLSERADIVARFQGGHNAGHTLVIDGVTYKLSLLPSGVVRPGKVGVIGAGVALDPYALFDEIKRVSAQNLAITPENLKIADNACLILSVHGELDRMREAAAGNGKIGTTGRGIGPVYEDKAGRRAVRVADLSDPEGLRLRLERLLTHHNALRVGFGAEPVAVETLEAELAEVTPKLLPFVTSVPAFLSAAEKNGRKILFEGAQGVFLDADHGTFPFVTSSNTVSAQAAIGCGVGTKSVGFVLGILKAYATRVGSGPFPTELHDETGVTLGERGHEFGTVTGRARRCGRFDAVMARQAALTGGVDGIALTKLDVLDVFDTLKICVAYELDGKRIDYLPASSRDQDRVTPIYEELDGWGVSTAGVSKREDLPENALRYIRRIEELTERPVTLISTSPKREDTILLRDPWEN